MKKAWALMAVFLSLSLSCATSRLGKDTSPEEKEFLSKVRYIITGHERKVFLKLPASERAAFIEEFWKKRDPDPETEQNEYKDRYFQRIEEANHLFTEGGHNGWLQDRGRVYILLGPPEQRETYPRGVNLTDPPSEIWHYGFYRIYFVDSRFNGDFRLLPESAQMLVDINTAQLELKPRMFSEKAALFDFDLKTEQTGEGDVLLRVEIPYQDIWFSSKDGKLQTSLELAVVVLKDKKSYPLSFAEDAMKEMAGKNYRIDVQLQLDPGDYTANVTLKSASDQSQVRKKIQFSVEKKSTHPPRFSKTQGPSEPDGDFLAAIFEKKIENTYNGFWRS
jgi:GWxTD domain-containing protein